MSVRHFHHRLVRSILLERVDGPRRLRRHRFGLVVVPQRSLRFLLGLVKLLIEGSYLPVDVDLGLQVGFLELLPLAFYFLDQLFGLRLLLPQPVFGKLVKIRLFHQVLMGQDRVVLLDNVRHPLDELVLRHFDGFTPLRSLGGLLLFLHQLPFIVESLYLVFDLLHFIGLADLLTELPQGYISNIGRCSLPLFFLFGVIDRSGGERVPPQSSQPFFQFLLLVVELLKSFVHQRWSVLSLKQKWRGKPSHKQQSDPLIMRVIKPCPMIQSYIKSILMRIIVVALLVAAVFASYDVKWDCVPCSSSAIGKNCFSITGGPFSSYEVSIDDQYSSCQNTGLFFPMFFTFSCRETCKGCGVDISMGSLFQSACTQDQNGQNVVTSLNLFYSKYTSTPGASYNWCGDVSCGVSQGLITIVAVAAIAVVGLIVGTVLHCKRKDRAEGTLSEEYAAIAK